MHNILVFIYFMYIQIFPITQDTVQLSMIAVLGAIAVFNFIASLHKKGVLRKNKNVFALQVLLLNSFLFTSFGFLADRPGAGEFLFLETIFPLIYLAIFSTIPRDRMIKILELCFTVSTFIIGVLFILQILNFNGGNDLLSILGDSSEIQGVATNSDGQVTGLRFMPLYSLSYLASISLHKLASSINDFFSKEKIEKTKMEKFSIIIHFFNFSSTLFCIILSGRQGLIVGFFGSLFIIVAAHIVVSLTWKSRSTNYIQEGAKHLRLILTSILFFVALILLVNSFVEFVKIDYEYIQGFMVKNGGDMERIGQFGSLLDSWSNSPIIGHGNGSTVSFIRDSARPWRYELSYMMRLNNMGLLGISIYLFGISLICISLIKNFYKTGKIVYMSSLAGLLSLLIADGTNPYMVRFTVLYYLYYCLWLSINKEEQLLKRIT